jgi:hypothetical protein
MKIDSTYTPVTDFRQTKSAKEDRPDGKNHLTDSGINDSVELPCQESAVGITPMAFFSEALEVTRSMDYHKAAEAHVVSGDVSSRLLSLI